MPIPNIKAAQKAVEAEETTTRTILCNSCKRVLWVLDDPIEYGTKKNYRSRVAMPGVKDYDEVWKKTDTGYQVANEDLLCPFCSEPHMRAVQAGEHTFPVPYVLELG